MNKATFGVETVIVPSHVWTRVGGIMVAQNSGSDAGAYVKRSPHTSPVVELTALDSGRWAIRAFC